MERDKRDKRIKLLKEREADLQQKIKDVEKDPNIPNKEHKLDMLRRRLTRMTERIKELSEEKD